MDVERVGEVLAERRLAALRRIAALAGRFEDLVASSVDANADDEHDPEGHTIAFERSQVTALAQQARADLVEVDDALARLRDGTFGTCQVCRSPIAEGRLRARPTARTCVGCVVLVPHGRRGRK